MDHCLWIWWRWFRDWFSTQWISIWWTLCSWGRLHHQIISKIFLIHQCINLRRVSCLVYNWSEPEQVLHYAYEIKYSIPRFRMHSIFCIRSVHDKVYIHETIYLASSMWRPKSKIIKVYRLSSTCQVIIAASIAVPLEGSQVWPLLILAFLSPDLSLGEVHMGPLAPLAKPVMLADHWKLAERNLTVKGMKVETQKEK